VGPRAGLDVTQNNLLLLSGNEPQFLDRPARSIVTIPIKLPRLYTFNTCFSLNTSLTHCLPGDIFCGLFFDDAIP
jgi:hypothetical protein